MKRCHKPLTNACAPIRRETRTRTNLHSLLPMDAAVRGRDNPMVSRTDRKSLLPLRGVPHGFGVVRIIHVVHPERRRRALQGQVHSPLLTRSPHAVVPVRLNRDSVQRIHVRILHDVTQREARRPDLRVHEYRELHSLGKKISDALFGLRHPPWPSGRSCCKAFRPPC